VIDGLLVNSEPTPRFWVASGTRDIAFPRRATPTLSNVPPFFFDPSFVDVED
jgi:hypothetical protein